jgi:biotin synthase
LPGIDTREALEEIGRQGKDIYALLARANQVRIAHRGMTVRLCGVVNAKSGMCTEDCKFCAQSAHNDAHIDCYDLIDSAEMVSAAQKSQQATAGRFGIVTSGSALADQGEVDSVCAAVEKIKSDLDILPCASLGNVDRSVLARLKQAGLTRYHCNLETARSFFDQICTTRDWVESENTIRAAKELGLATCCGGIFGLGETEAQRVELLEQIRDLGVDSVPLNFHHPIPGTAFEALPLLTPLECLKIIAVARLMMPDREIRVCGGREHILGDLQSWSLISGACGLMVGGYLTTSGRDVKTDLKMISDAGFEVEHD